MLHTQDGQMEYYYNTWSNVVQGSSLYHFRGINLKLTARGSIFFFGGGGLIQIRGSVLSP